jgi:hypothetical protein
MPNYIYLEEFTKKASSIKEAANMLAADIMKNIYGSETVYFTIDPLHAQHELKSLFWLRDSSGGGQTLHVRRID